MSGSPASGIPVKVSAKLFSGSTSKNEDFERNTDGSGQVIVSIGVPPTISEVQLSVGPHPHGSGWAGREASRAGRWRGESWVPGPFPLTLRPLPSLQVSAGSPHPAVGGLTVKAPLSRSSGFLSIEWRNPRPLKVGETLNLNLQAVGISGSFSHFYYMVRMTGLQGRTGVGGSQQEGALRVGGGLRAEDGQ